MSGKYNKRIFTIKEHIGIINHAAKSYGVLLHTKKHKLFNKKFKERIMLAVTEVNGCELCSYVHTKVALGSGMDSNEIKTILNGIKDDIPKDELVAVLFAEYFASSHEKVEKEMVERLIEEYGREKSKIICAILAMITMTNSMGIALALFKDRLKFNRNKKSRLINELGIPFLTMTIFPFLFLFYKVKSIFKKPTCHLIPNLV